MSLTKMQFAALMFLTGSVVGIGVGWLPQWVFRSEPTKPPPAAAEEESTARFDTERMPAAVQEKEPVLFQGKPASYWLAALRDRDPGFRKNAIVPLAVLADVDRTLISPLCLALKDEEWGVQKEAAECLINLKPPVLAAVPALFHCDLGLKTILPILKKIDPNGEATIPLAHAALEEKELRIRAGFVLLAYDKDVRLPVSLLIEALSDKESFPYFHAGNKGEVYPLCEAQILAAWLLKQRGPEAWEAVPALVETLKNSEEKYYDSYSPFEAVLNTDNPTDWFATTLTSVDPDGQWTIPLLVKMLQPLAEDRLVGEGSHREEAVSARFDHNRIRHKAARVLRHYGPKAKAAVPLLTEIVKDKESKEPSEWNKHSITGFGESETTVKWCLREDAINALRKIDPKAIETKEPPLAKPSKSPRKSKNP